MEIIKEIKISNYKGLQQIQFPCKSLNIIVGPNNTGKSSILESIFLSISSLNNFEDILKTQLDDVLNLVFMDNLKYFAYEQKKESTIEIELYDNNTLKSDLYYSQKGYPQVVANDIISFINKISLNETSDNYRQTMKKFRPGSINNLYKDMSILENVLNQKDDENLSRYADSKRKLEFENMLKIISQKLDSEIQEYRSEVINSEKLVITSKLNNNLIAIHVSMDSYTGEIPTLDSEMPLFYKIPLIISTPKNFNDISVIHKKILNTKKLNEVLGLIRERIPYFEDIREAEGDLFVLLENIKEPLPLSFMGDGFKALLKLSFMSPLIKKGVVLFEEPETSLHPGYLDILAKEILVASDNSQFFLTTHSLEFIERILEKAEKFNKLDSINILRLRRLSEGDIEREILTGRGAKEELELIETDLRGY